MRFSRQGYWSGLPFPSSGDPPNPGIEPRGLLHCRQILYQLNYKGIYIYTHTHTHTLFSSPSSLLLENCRVPWWLRW